MPNANVRSEIKDMDQIRKERQNKASRIAHMKTKSPKGRGKGKGKGGKGMGGKGKNPGRNGKRKAK